MNDDIIDWYYESLKQSFPCTVEENFNSTKYEFRSREGRGTFTRFKLERGFEVCFTKIDQCFEMRFDNRKETEEMLEVGFCLEGTVTIDMESSLRSLAIKKGDMFIYQMNNDEEQFNFKYTDSKSISISLSRDAIIRQCNKAYSLCAEHAWSDEIECMFKSSPLIIEKANFSLVKQMKRLVSIDSQDILGLVSLKAAALEAIATAVSEKKTQCDLSCSQCTDDLKIKRAIWLIDHEVEHVYSLDHLAKLIGLSTYKIQKGFKEKTGITAYQYILKQRIERGAALIRTSDLSILDVANEIGYENPSKFAQVFKRRYGLAPLEYRKKYIEDNGTLK